MVEERAPRLIVIEDTGSFLLVDCPMAQLKVTLDECAQCPYHGGKRKEIRKETILGDPQHLFVAGSIACNYPEESEAKT
ncbi:MAG: hypothetical protein V3S25_05370 [Nitrospirales bacterium]